MQSQVCLAQLGDTRIGCSLCIEAQGSILSGDLRDPSSHCHLPSVHETARLSTGPLGLGCTRLRVRATSHRSDALNKADSADSTCDSHQLSQRPVPTHARAQRDAYMTCDAAYLKTHALTAPRSRPVARTSFERGFASQPHAVSCEAANRCKKLTLF